MSCLHFEITGSQGRITGFIDLDHKNHQNQDHAITRIIKIKIIRSQNIFDPGQLDQKIMDYKYDPQFYYLIFGLTTVGGGGVGRILGE